MFICWDCFVPLENFSFIWRRHHYRWKVSNFDLCSALVTIEQWGFLACHTYCDTGHPFIVVITEDLRHSHLLPSVGQWNCHYLYLPLRLVEAGIVCCTFSYVLYSSGVEQSVIPKSKMARDKYEYASIIRILKDNLTYLYFLLNIFRTNKHNNSKHFAR